MFRKDLIKLAEETVSIISDKKYSISDKVIPCFVEDEYMRFKSPFEVNKEKNNKPATIEVRAESTIDAIHRMKNEKLGVLNFASAKNPCGGFLSGSRAQEECLAYCSDLYIKQWPQAQDFYIKHRKLNFPLYTDDMFINKVVFFRDSDFNLIETPSYCKVLTSPAVNAGIARNMNISEEDIQNTMKNRMRKILNCFIEAECESIILGAFGCGVFQNSAESVSQFWKELLIDEEYQYYFKNICFSVIPIPEHNYNVFIEKFQQ